MSSLDSPPGLLARKRRKSESTPPITNFFPSIKKQRSTSESKNVSLKLDDCPSLISIKENSDEDSVPLEYSEDELCELFGIPNKTSQPSSVPDSTTLSPLENLPKTVYNRIFTILDIHSIASLSLSSTTMSNQVKRYMTDYAFYRRFQLDNLDFVNSSIRPDDDDYYDNDPYYAVGSLLKSVTISLDTHKRALVFLNVCRNLRNQAGGSLSGFGRALEGMTECWKFAERRIMVKAAILIDSELHSNIATVLTSTPGKYIGLEMKIRSSLNHLFLNRTQEVDDTSPDEIIEFGAWLSILLKNFTEKYQGRLYYLLFGPTILSRTGEKIDWDYFGKSVFPEFPFRPSVTMRSQSVFKTRLISLLNGVRALRIMSNSRAEVTWNNNKIYRLFLRVIEVSSMKSDWPTDASSMALAIDTSGLLCEYLKTCLDPLRDDYDMLRNEAADMICRVRCHLYSWTADPASSLSESLHHAFNHLSQLDGNIGGSHYKSFLDEIWNAQNSRINSLVSKHTESRNGFQRAIQEELNGQISILRLLCDFSDVILIHQQHNRGDFEGFQLNDLVRNAILEQDEQDED